MPKISEIEDDFGDPDDMVLDDPPSPTLPAPATIAKGNLKGKAKAATPSNAPTPSLPGGKPPFSLPSTFKHAEGYDTKHPDEYKEWTTIYPIYLDSKKPIKAGGRKVPKKLAVPWPLAEPIAFICARLGYETVFEPDRSHPQDWENPGRVKVLLAIDGKPVIPTIKNKRALLHRLGPLLAPHQPSTPAPTRGNPHPLPPIHTRLPPNSPAISHGSLESALSGGGMGGLLGNMFGGGGAQEKEEEVPRIEDKKPQAKVVKPKKVHIKRR
ncbi:signal recognition particle, SRP19 subunit [Meredithblackwellia eburnea MCA 4105]